MSNDLYLRAVLTVIALCLVWMCFNGVTPKAFAQAKPAEPMRVVLVDERNVAISTAQGLNVGLQTVPVSIAAPVPVRVTSIERSGVWQPIEVRVLREAPTLAPTP